MQVPDLNFHVLCSRSVCFCFVFSFKANLAVNSGFFFVCKSVRVKL